MNEIIWLGVITVVLVTFWFFIWRRRRPLLCDQPMCGRCYDFVDRLYPVLCKEKPEALLGQPIGQYHCPDCGTMLIAGMPHPEVCVVCVIREHPSLDRPSSAPDWPVFPRD